VVTAVANSPKEQKKKEDKNKKQAKKNPQGTSASERYLALRISKLSCALREEREMVVLLCCFVRGPAEGR
jgi:hypothetical protein